MSRDNRPRRLRLALVVMATLAAARARTEAQPAPGAHPRGEPPGSDVIVMAREALLREKPSRESRFIGKLRGGSRLTLLEAGEKFLKVDIGAASPPADAAGKRATASVGWVSRDVASAFPPDPATTLELAALGRSLSASESHRRLGAAFLLRAAERLRAGGSDDPSVEVALGEAAESLAASGGPFPPGLEVVDRAAGAGHRPRWLYTGDAFRRAIALVPPSPAAELEAIRDRALAGALRQHYADPPASIQGAADETAAWLDLVEKTRDPSAARCAADRAGQSSLTLGRMLIAAGRAADLEKLAPRLLAAGNRAQSLVPKEVFGAKLSSRGNLLLAMRGAGSASFPQEARVRLGPKEVLARIDGKPGALTLTVETTVGGTHDGPRKRAAIPILPVPGSLRVSPDGRSVAWVEIAEPSKLLPVVTSLERDEPAREIAYRSSGRRLGEAPLAHVVATLSGYSTDGQRLGLTIRAWNETPAHEARYSVVSVATGDLLFETSTDVKGFRRLIQ